jgi:hypothetical protein
MQNAKPFPQIKVLWQADIGAKDSDLSNISSSKEERRRKRSEERNFVERTFQILVLFKRIIDAFPDCL